MERSFDDQWREFYAAEVVAIKETPGRWFSFASLMYKWQYKQWFLSLLDLLGDEQMARGKGASQNKLPENASSWTQFVTIPITAEQGVEMVKYYKDSGKLYSDFTALCVAGHRVGFSYDARTDAIICSVTCKAEGAPNFGKTFTSFASDWYTALMVSMYKHYVVTNEVWAGENATVARPAFG